MRNWFNERRKFSSVGLLTESSSSPSESLPSSTFLNIDWNEFGKGSAIPQKDEKKNKCAKTIGILGMHHYIVIIMMQNKLPRNKLINSAGSCWHIWKGVIWEREEVPYCVLKNRWTLVDRLNSCLHFLLDLRQCSFQWDLYWWVTILFLENYLIL